MHLWRLQRKRPHLDDARDAVTQPTHETRETRKTRMKITIIGASTAGLFAAHLLAKEGFEVHVYERGSRLGSVPRTLIVTSKIGEVLGFIPDEAILNRVRYVELFSRSRSVRLELSQPDLVIERAKLIQALAHKAREAGARIILNHRFIGFAHVGSKIAITLKNLETGGRVSEATDVLVGADGAFSTVSRAALCDGHHLTALLQARVPLPENVAHDTFQVWFDPSRTKYFYWLIPESESRAAVGLIADDADQAGASLKAFLDERQLEPLDYQAAMVPMHQHKVGERGWFQDALGGSPLGRNVYLIGDAAAQVKVTTVGGVVTGLRGAKALSEALVKGRDYRREVRRLKRELDLHLLLRHLLNRFNAEDYDELLALLSARLRNVLAERTRDELAETFLHLILAEPRLLRLGGKALLRAIIRTERVHLIRE